MSAFQQPIFVKSQCASMNMFCFQRCSQPPPCSSPHKPLGGHNLLHLKNLSTNPHNYNDSNIDFTTKHQMRTFFFCTYFHKLVVLHCTTLAQIHRNKQCWCKCRNVQYLQRKIIPLVWLWCDISETLKTHKHFSVRDKGNLFLGTNHWQMLHIVDDTHYCYYISLTNCSCMNNAQFSSIYSIWLHYAEMNWWFMKRWSQRGHIHWIWQKVYWIGIAEP